MSRLGQGLLDLLLLALDVWGSGRLAVLCGVLEREYALIGKEFEKGPDLPFRSWRQLEHSKAFPPMMIECRALPENVLRFLWRLRTDLTGVAVIPAQLEVFAPEESKPCEPSDAPAEILPIEAQELSRFSE